jgi:putative thiamine transport system permease protein
MNKLGALPLTALFLVPLVASLTPLEPALTNLQSFADLFAHPQFVGATKLTLVTGIISTLMALLIAIVIVAGAHDKLQRDAGVFLAVPHAALAMGLALLIAPTGAIARVMGTLLGWTEPPQWITTQDPSGWSLIAALVLKETPFLVWALMSLLNRDDVKNQLRGQTAAARSFGRGSLSIWLSVLLPQLLPRIVWPLIAVFTYGCTVVDMAIVIGPNQPPTLANLIWTDLNDADPAINGRGTAGVLTLSVMILVLLSVVSVFLRLCGPLTKILFLQYRPPGNLPNALGTQIWGFWRALYLTIALFLILASFSGQWPFPNFRPEVLTPKGWQQLASNMSPILNSLALATVSSFLSLAASIVWMETQNPKTDRVMLSAAALTLCLPSLVIGLGQYRMFLATGITGSAAAMLLAHVLPVAAYVFVMLNGPYRSYDHRWQATSAGLLKSRTQFLIRIKWPMLKAPILSAIAVGFAVSIAQFVPAQLASAGRYTTLPIEAVTLTSGGSRSLIAVYALALMALPLIVFIVTSWFAKPRYA